jgi:beta-lactam-binding protein with PASTA domain/tRNA A-37 threonylcarbamoyl transferase component Bud32
MDQYIGKLLDNRYELLERIGSGGMAVVYKARCHRLNRLVAVKILKSDLAQDAEFRRRFHDESQAVAMLSHPNIVAVYDVSHSDQLDYIVMELIDGITLKQYMQKKGEPLSWRESLHFITQIMKALGHAHSRGIIHRDIKPHNIMVLRDGSVKVADFGIARLASAAQNTLTQEALGSVHYISPEQAKGSHIDARSDIYSAGVVLYEMLTGRLPYEGDSPISVAIQHINSIPLSPREVNPDIPEAMEAITMKAMAPRVDQRYLSADAMLADLEEFRKNPNINFEYTSADLLGGADEPTQVLGAGVGHAGRATAAPAARGGEQAGRPVRRRRVEDDLDDEGDNRRARGKSSPAPAVAAVGAIVIFLLAVIYFVWTVISSMGPEDVIYTVPDLLTGMTIEDAMDNKDLLGEFTIERGKTLYDRTEPEGQIVDQDPKPGTTVKSGGLTIKVDVSGGDSNTYEMEEFYNRSASVARAILESHDIYPEIEEAFDDVVTSTFVISQSVPKGTKLKPGDPVTLVVSKGPEKKSVAMISLIKLTEEEAKQKLNAAGLDLGQVTPTYDAEAAVGTVIWQSVAPTVSVPEGTVVDVKISQGPDPSVSPPPDTSESPGTSPTSPDTPKKVAKVIEVELPSEPEMVDVVITVNGVEAEGGRFEDTPTNMRKIKPTIWGSGLNQEVCIYIDGVLKHTRYIDFVP